MRCDTAANNTAAELAAMEEASDLLFHLPLRLHGRRSGPPARARRGRHRRGIPHQHLQGCPAGGISAADGRRGSVPGAGLGSDPGQEVGLHHLNGHPLRDDHLVCLGVEFQLAAGGSHGAGFWKWGV